MDEREPSHPPFPVPFPRITREHTHAQYEPFINMNVTHIEKVSLRAAKLAGLPSYTFLWRFALDGWMDGWMDGWKDGRIDGRKEGGKEGRKEGRKE